MWNTKKLLMKAKRHFAPALSWIVECYKFRRCVKQPVESMASFVAQLHALAMHCGLVKCWRICFVIILSADFQNL